MTTTQKKFAVNKHWVQLKELGYIGASMAQISTIERRAHKLAKDLCDKPVSEAEQARREKEITEQVKKVFGGTLPEGFFINLDPRGYALKLAQQYIITRDGQFKAYVADESEALYKLHRLQGQSYDYATKHGGWKVERNHAPQVTYTDWGGYSILSPEFN